VGGDIVTRTTHNVRMTDGTFSPATAHPQSDVDVIIGGLAVVNDHQRTALARCLAVFVRISRPVMATISDSGNISRAAAVIQWWIIGLETERLQSCHLQRILNKLLTSYVLRLTQPPTVSGEGNL